MALICFGRERACPSFFAEVEPLLKAHQAEVESPLISDGQALDPDWDSFLALEAAGALRLYTVRRRGRLAGYWAFVVRADLHYKTQLTASGDVLFLHREFRKGGTGGAFIRWCVAALKEEGVNVVNVYMKAKHRFTLPDLGFELTDLHYAARLQ